MHQHPLASLGLRSMVEPALRRVFARPVSHPMCYAALLVLGVLDICFTALILHMGGEELNSAADWVLHRFGLAGMAVFKFLLVSMAIVSCEVVAWQRPALAARLVRCSAAISLFPVVVGALCLGEVFLGPEENLRYFAALRMLSGDATSS